MKIKLSVFLILLLSGCSVLPWNRSNHLKSECSELFGSCKRVESVTDCTRLEGSEDVDLDWINRIVKIEGPLNLIDVDSLHESEEYFLLSGDYKLADSFWWFIEGNEYSGTQGVIGVNECRVVSRLDYYLWIVEMF